MIVKQGLRINFKIDWQASVENCRKQGAIEKMKQGYDIAIKAQQQIKEEIEYEKEIVCRVVNGNKVKKRKVKQESELSEIAEK